MTDFRTGGALLSVLLALAAGTSFAQPTSEPPQQDENDAYTSARGFPEYRIGSGDELLIRIWTGIEEREYEVAVQSDGSIFLPFVGLANLPAGDRSALELRDLIVERLRQSFREPAAEVRVTNRVARVVTLLGEIRTAPRGDTGPGRYPLPGRIRLVDFVTEHGGVTVEADLNNTQLIRDGKSSTYNLSRAVFQGDIDQNPILDDGDLVYIPPLSTSSRKYLVFGEVNDPGLLELPSSAPIAEVIARAGGFTVDAHKSEIVVLRGGLEQPMLLRANFEDLKRGDIAQNLTLESGDMIFVGRRKLAGFRDIMSSFTAPLSFIYTSLLVYTVANNESTN